VIDPPRVQRPPTGDEQLADVVQREGSRLRRFIRHRVADPRDVEDIVQDVFYALLKANRLLMPIEHITGWLFRAARNRIIDLYRARMTEPLELEDLLPSRGGGPEDEYARALLLEALEEAIAELPAEQRDVHMNIKRFWKWHYVIPALLVVGPLIVALVVFVAGGIVMLLWNWLLPPLFDWPRITLLEGFGLLALGRILFGGFGGGGGGQNQMSPEERERFRGRMRDRFCSTPSTPLVTPTPPDAPGS
jgi:RNA polymerase sigma factor (sigma-70 family)